MAPESAPPGSALELLDALSGLRPEFRAVLVLKYWARYSETEIASTMDVRPGTVKTWTRRALAQLRSQSDVWGTKSVAIGEPGNPVDDATDTTTDRAENDIRTATNAESER